MVENWVDFALNVVGGGMALIFLFEGTRRLGAHGAHRKAGLMIALAAIVCAAYGTVAYRKYLDDKTSLGVNQRKATPSELQRDWGRTLAPEKRESASLARARHAFVESGAIGTYFDRSGEVRRFAPNLEDVQKRERVVAHFARLEYEVRSSLAEALLWLLLGPVAIVLGLLMSLDKGPPKEENDGSDLNGAQSSP